MLIPIGHKKSLHLEGETPARQRQALNVEGAHSQVTIHRAEVPVRPLPVLRVPSKLGVGFRCVLEGLLEDGLARRVGACGQCTHSRQETEKDDECLLKHAHSALPESLN